METPVVEAIDAARQAHFPYTKTIENFDFVFQSSLRRQQLGP